MIYVIERGKNKNMIKPSIPKKDKRVFTNTIDLKRFKREFEHDDQD